ncbi:MAG: hypothetical protein ACRDD1_14335, partial [Planctomycetia bacterium]
MPNPWAAAGIVAFWLFMTGLLVQRDVLPRLGIGEVDYRRVLAERAVEEPARWSISVDGKPSGSVTSFLRARQSGGYISTTRATFASGLLLPNSPYGKSTIILQFEIRVGPTGRLKRFRAEFAVEGSSLTAAAIGNVDEDGRNLKVTVEGVPGFTEFEVPFDPDAVFVDSFGSLDR